MINGFWLRLRRVLLGGTIIAFKIASSVSKAAAALGFCACGPASYFYLGEETAPLEDATEVTNDEFLFSPDI